MGFTVSAFSSPETPPRKRAFHSLNSRQRQVFNSMNGPYGRKGPGNVRRGASRYCHRTAAVSEYVFSEEGSSFVPDGTRFVLTRLPSDESLGYFRASLRDLDSRCVLMRSKRVVAGERFPVEPRMARVSRRNTDSKVPSGTTDTVSTVGCRCKDDKSPAGAKESGAPGAPTKIGHGRGLQAPFGRFTARTCRTLGELRNVPGILPRGNGVQAALRSLALRPR